LKVMGGERTRRERIADIHHFLDLGNDGPTRITTFWDNIPQLVASLRARKAL
jgi:hypothetical protein